MGHGRHVTVSSYEITAPPAPPPIADYHVTGPTTPDICFDYFLGGIHNGHNYYRTQDSSWFIWREVGDLQWFISTALDLFGAFHWTNNTVPIEAVYSPSLGGVGDATVIAGPE